MFLYACPWRRCGDMALPPLNLVSLPVSAVMLVCVAFPCACPSLRWFWGDWLACHARWHRQPSCPPLNSLIPRIFGTLCQLPRQSLPMSPFRLFRWLHVLPWPLYFPCPRVRNANVVWLVKLDAPLELTESCFAVSGSHWCCIVLGLPCQLVSGSKARPCHRTLCNTNQPNQ